MKSNLQKSIILNKRVATLMIILFVIVFIVDAFQLTDYDVAQFKSLFAFVYLFTSLKYHQLSLKEKNATIASLEQKLNQYQN